jgi:hypothetical protein
MTAHDIRLLPHDNQTTRRDCTGYRYSRAVNGFGDSLDSDKD